MSRSKWKGPYIDIKQNIDDTKLKKNMNIISRNSEILPIHLGLSFNIYNGKTYSEIIVTERMIGFKFGEFSFTRAKFIFKKKKKK
jgi:small subunit ribosomal protein S19